MKFKYKLHIMLTALGMASCKKYLDVKPSDKILADEVYSSTASINAALNGIYVNLAKDVLYGGNLSATTLEVLGQRYNTNYGSGANQWALYQSYTYTDANVKATFQNIWEKTYANILNVNTFLKGLDSHKGVLVSSTDSLYHGEAYALRAMMHFDLLRLFGPMYSTADSTATAIPYYSQTTINAKPFLSAKSVMANVISDLTHAERLLSINDPILTGGIQPTALNDGKDYLRFRNYRLNYFALKALQARVYLYRGDKVSALNAAKAIIALNTAKSFFSWTTPSIVNGNGSDPNRILSSEILFGLDCQTLYTTYSAYFSPTVGDAALLAPNTTRIEATFNASSGAAATAGITLDDRFTSTWVKPSLTGESRTFYVFYKYADVTDKTKTFRLTMPMIRLSEAYYIAAECEPDVTAAKAYLETVRVNRGLVALTSITNMDTELLNEYRKEFYGEGQLFYYYKRKNITSIPSASSTTANLTMSKATYVVPIPNSETQNR